MLDKDYRVILTLWIDILVSVLLSWLFYFHTVAWWCDIWDSTHFEKDLVATLSHDQLLLGFCVTFIYLCNCIDLVFYSFKLDKKLGAIK